MNTRARRLRRAVQLSVLSIAWSASVGLFAVYSALANGSLSLLGFGADAVIDAAASIALVWRFLVESRDPERASRVERAAEGVVGLALMALAVYLAFASVRSIAAGTHPDTSSATVALLLASIVVLLPLAIAKRRVAASLASGALRADSVLTAAAALLAAISLASLAAVQALGFWWADAAGALVVAVVVVRAGWSSLTASRSGS